MSHPGFHHARRAGAGILAIILAGWFGAGVLDGAPQQGGQDLPRFTSSVEVTTIDVSVFDERGRPVTDLKPQDFSVRVDGGARRVVTAEWVPLEAPTAAAPAKTFEDYSSNDGGTGGRLILLVVDQPNIRFGGTMGIRRALNAFIDRLQPSDRAAVVSVGNGPHSTPFTNDRARLKRAISLMAGQYQPPDHFLYRMSLSEALDITRGLTFVLEQVALRECAPDDLTCALELESIAREIVRQGNTGAQDTVVSLRRLLINLRVIEAPKTLILVSEGFLGNDDAGIAELGTLAAEARTSIYAMKLDDQFLEFSAENRSAPLSRMADTMERARGMELLASASRGTIINVVGDGSGAISRIESELSGYYLLGVESGENDRNGKLHPVRVEVSRKGATVRTRRAVMTRADTPSPLVNPRRAVAEALATPLPVSALPLKVATFSLQSPDSPKVHLLIHADIGTDYAASRVVSLAYMITDAEARVVDSQVATARLPTVMTGVPSPLQFAAGAGLPPGDYTLKLAVAEGERVGTVEHPFSATIKQAGPVTTSDLMVGGPLTVGTAPLNPTVGQTVAFGAVHGYVEAYGAAAQTLTARYEIESAAGDEPILSETVRPTLAGAGNSRAIFTHIMPVRQLPPGPYRLRVTLSSRDETLSTTARLFEVAAPAVLMTSANGSADINLPRDVFLPVPEPMMSRPFDRAAATSNASVQAFRDHVPEAAREPFDEGIRLLAEGDLPSAEKTFKSVINPEADSTAAIAYTAATFAAAGKDLEAANAWQTALVDGSEIPEIYVWLVGSLLRIHDLSQARGALDEAIGKWPGDVRFARPMAIVYAALGQGAEAVRTLERHLDAHRDDMDALMLGVEWIYQLRQSGASAHTPAEDARLARRYADAYINGKGPQAALVRQWMEAIEGRRR